MMFAHGAIARRTNTEVARLRKGLQNKLLEVNHAGFGGAIAARLWLIPWNTINLRTKIIRAHQSSWHSRTLRHVRRSRYGGSCCSSEENDTENYTNNYCAKNMTTTGIEWAGSPIFHELPLFRTMLLWETSEERCTGHIDINFRYFGGCSGSTTSVKRDDAVSHMEHACHRNGSGLLTAGSVP